MWKNITHEKDLFKNQICSSKSGFSFQFVKAQNKQRFNHFQGKDNEAKSQSFLNFFTVNEYLHRDKSTRFSSVGDKAQRMIAPLF